MTNSSEGVNPIDEFPITPGAHAPVNGQITGTCAGERAFWRWAMRQGWSQQQIVEGWTASMICASPMISSFVISSNDRMRDDAHLQVGGRDVLAVIAAVFVAVVVLIVGAIISEEREDARKRAAKWRMDNREIVDNTIA